MDNIHSDSLNILIVEDSSSARRCIVSSLAGIGAVLFETDDGLPAYAFLKKDPLKIDLVLSDLIMKKMHGDELCFRIRQDLGIKDLPIIILSSRSDKDTIVKLFQAGVSDYLFKPFTPEELVARIRAHLNQRSLHKILMATIDELKESNRMKDHFLAVCSHDFRSPLQGIIGYADLMIHDASLKEKHKRMLRNIMKSGHHLNGLIDSLLNFPLTGKSPEKIAMVSLNLVNLLQSCVANISFGAVNKGIELNFSPPSGLPRLKGNHHALSRVFNNLLNNAVKFTPPGGTIKVDVRPADENTISVSIKDSGIGIAQEAIPAIFDCYSKASRTGTEGETSTGLGLYISRQLVDLHQGKILVSSGIDEGTCFTVILPLAPPTAPD